MLLPRHIVSIFACCLCMGAATAQGIPNSLEGLATAAPTNTDIPYQLEADDIQYDLETGAATASGAVEVTDGTQTVRADKIVYNAKADSLAATGNVVYLTGRGPALYLDELTLTGQLKQATLSELRLRIPELGEILQAREASKDENVLTLKDAIYSPCQNCLEGTDRKLWQVRADTIKYDTDTYRATYQNAVLDVYGVPVAYLPYFSHPVGSPVPQSGFLFPQFGNSENLGDEITLGYYVYRPETNVDYTIRARGLSSRGVQTQLERRQHFGGFDSDISGSFINDSRRSTFRGHLKSESEYTLQPGRRIGVNAEVSSDDVYLNDFFGRNDSFLPSTAYFEDASQNETSGHYFGLNATHFQDLEADRDPGETAQVLPRVQFERYWQLGETNPFGAVLEGAQLTASVDGLALERSSGTSVRRIVTQAEVEKPWILPDTFLGGGNKVTLKGELRGDIYQVEDGPSDEGLLFRGIPQISAKWERPLLNSNTNHVITPLVMGIYSPRGGNLDGDIPNEDSTAFELDRNNLFSTNRFAGLDRVENGPRIIYGLDNRWGEAGDVKWRVFAGQSWRQFDDDDLPISGGTTTDFSDWIGFIEGTPTDWLTFSSFARLDNSDFAARRLDNFARLGHVDKNFLQVSHTFLDDGPEEIQIEGGWQITDKLRFEGSTRQNLDNGGQELISEGTFSYILDCVEMNFTLRRSGFTNVDVQPSTDFLVNITLLTFGHNNN